MAREVTIKLRAFPYYITETDPVTLQDIRVEKIARRGEVVELDDLDYRRALRFAAIEEASDTESKAANTEALQFETASSTDLAEFIKVEKPTVSYLVEKVGSDKDLAGRVLEAENLATGNQPRQTLVEQLEKVQAGS